MRATTLRGCVDLAFAPEPAWRFTAFAIPELETAASPQPATAPHPNASSKMTARPADRSVMSIDAVSQTV
jgi:hypothetical protein